MKFIPVEAAIVSEETIVKLFQKLTIAFGMFLAARVSFIEISSSLIYCIV